MIIIYNVSHIRFFDCLSMANPFFRSHNKIYPVHCSSRLKTFIRTTEGRQENNYISKYMFKYYRFK